MKKRITMIVLILAAAMLASLVVGTVIAGKGQKKLSFQWYLVGMTTGTSERSWESANNTHTRGGGFESLGDSFVLVDGGGVNEELIEADYLGYEGFMETQNHNSTFYCIRVIETVYIYADTGKQTLRGTLEIQALGDNKGGYGANFVAFGTGEFEGVKVDGESEPLTVIGGNPNPPYYYFVLNRIGTVMGWP